MPRLYVVRIVFMMNALQRLILAQPELVLAMQDQKGIPIPCALAELLELNLPEEDRLPRAA